MHEPGSCKKSDLEQAWLTQLQTRPYLYEDFAFQDLINAAVAISQSEIGYFHLFDQGSDSIHLAVWSDGAFPISATSQASHYPLKNAGIWADAIRLRQPVIHNEYPQTKNFQGLPQSHFPVTRHLSIPIFNSDQEIVAILGVGNAENPYTPEQSAQLARFCQTVFPVVQKRVQDIRSRRHGPACFTETDTLSLLMQMLSCLTSAAALKDEYTAQHSQNVADLAVGIAAEMGLEEDVILGLRLGALVHDIGKMAIPTEILTKPGRLHQAEFNLIKTHVERGVEIFQSVQFPWPILEMIRQHHERLDGSGYPVGLQDEAIILEARIIAVADTFDAMSSNRPYRFAPGVERAITELKKGRAIKYDSVVVDTCLRYLQKVDHSFWHRYPSTPEPMIPMSWMPV